MAQYTSNNPTYNYKGRLFRVNAEENTSKALYTAYLKKTIEQIESFMSYHSKLFVFIIQLHLPSSSANNRVMTQFLNKLRLALISQYSFKRIGYIWCREQDKAPAQHYHLALMLDGSKIQYPAKLMSICENIWAAIAGGTIHRPENCYYHFHRTDEAAINDVVYRLSYFSKVRSKHLTPKTAHMFGSSKLKPKAAKPFA
ncbi:YagK/YfjJ domain-containing protein [Shewanella gaetbuli]